MEFNRSWALPSVLVFPYLMFLNLRELILKGSLISLWQSIPQSIRLDYSLVLFLSSFFSHTNLCLYIWLGVGWVVFVFKKDPTKPRSEGAWSILKSFYSHFMISTNQGKGDREEERKCFGNFQLCLLAFTVCVLKTLFTMAMVWRAAYSTEGDLKHIPAHFLIRVQPNSTSFSAFPLPVLPVQPPEASPVSFDLKWSIAAVATRQGASGTVQTSMSPNALGFTFQLLPHFLKDNYNLFILIYFFSMAALIFEQHKY